MTRLTHPRPAPYFRGAIAFTVFAFACAVTAEAVPATQPVVDAWAVVGQLGVGINIGNTFDNTTRWETGWGNPPVTWEYVQALARLGFKTVRLPVAWDTYAVDGVIQADKFDRVNEVVDWITNAGMYCVLNIHWDGGWIDSDDKRRFPNTYATFSPAAEKKFGSYWRQIAGRFADKGGRLIFEGLNEESNFSGEGSDEKAYATLNRVNQLFVDTVRATGGNNARRLLIVAGYGTDFAKTCRREYQLPNDFVPGRLLLSVHYYTPWSFCGDENEKTARLTWGTEADEKQLTDLFDAMAAFCARTNTPAFVGEFGVAARRDPASRVRWLTAVGRAALSRKMIPVLWDTGGDVARRPPYAAGDDLTRALSNLLPTTRPAGS